MPGAAPAAPEWLRPLLTDVEARLRENPDQRWRDRDLRSRGLDPVTVRNWFQREHGLTFQAYARARRLSVTSVEAEGSREGRAPRRRRRDETVAESARWSRPDSRRHWARWSPPRWTRASPSSSSPTGACSPRSWTRSAGVCTRRPLPVVTATSRRLRAQLDEYFAGTRTAFDVPLILTGTPFEEASWTYLRTIPAGETRSYAQGAQALGRPTSFRAFARANGANRISIVIPCHRVIGSDGSLTGYGGGLDRKQALLDLEAQSVRAARVTAAESAA